MVSTYISIFLMLAISLIQIIKAEDSDYEFAGGQKLKLNQIPSKFKEQVDTYLKYNGYYEKETVDKETFVDIFMKVITEDSFTPLQKKNFRILGNELAEREGDIIRTKDIPTILNFEQVTQLYSELIDEGVVKMDPEDNPDLNSGDAENIEL